MPESPSILLTIGAFLLVLGPLVILHELGHYLVARWFKVRSDVFSIGFGKELAGWTDNRGTRWRLAAIPLGGYVQFAGDANAASMPDPDVPAEPGTFHAAALWKRALIVFAGPFANLLVAVAIFAVFNFSYGTPVAQPVIDSFGPKSAAQAAGFKIGDRIVAIDGARIDTFQDITEHVMLYPDRTVSISGERNGVEFVLPVKIARVTEKDRFGNVIERGMLGVATQSVKVEPVGPVRSVTLAVDQCMGIVRTMAAGIAQIVTGERSVQELGGPIRIAKFSGEYFSVGWAAFVAFAAMISINLAFINLLPIPVLDGGHLAMYAAEAIRRKPVSARSQEWAFRTGLAFVLALMLFATFNDIVSLWPFGN